MKLKFGSEAWVLKKREKQHTYVTYLKLKLKFGSEAWVLREIEEQRLEGAQMKFLRHLLGITKLDLKKKPMY